MFEFASNLGTAKPSKFWYRIRVLGLALAFLMAATICWLSIFAPPSSVPRPFEESSVTFLNSDGVPISRIGDLKEAPVDVALLPAHVANAFIAIEDRRFRTHWGVDPRGIGRAVVVRFQRGRWAEGGSTITQQLAKNAFLTPDRSIVRKAQEAVIAVWLEAWLTKDDILSRYLSTIYFGNGVYGLRAASHLYFQVPPERLTVGQATYLAALIAAPSQYSSADNFETARRRSRLVLSRMVTNEFLTAQQAANADVPAPSLHHARNPSGSYFTDWAIGQAREQFGSGYGELYVKTTMDDGIQRIADQTARSISVDGVQFALVAMRPDGRVVAMLGGRRYQDSSYNRAVQARRQPGSTFKLFVYLAALQNGLTPDSVIDGGRITIGPWQPRNADGQYPSSLTMRAAFASSNNLAAVRLAQRVGPASVIRVARGLGVSSELEPTPSLPLGTSGMSLLELTAAYAAVAAGTSRVDARWQQHSSSQTQNLVPMPPRVVNGMRDLLSAVVNEGTGREAALPTQVYGKTGTSQDNRDAWFVGYSGNLVVGVWLGRDDNRPMDGINGGGLAARVWRQFMAQALRAGR